MFSASLGLNDFPGQGTALIGVVDAFWDPKSYVAPAEYKRFSGPVVPLAMMEKRTYTSAENFSAKIRIAQYSATPLADAKPAWEITGSSGNKIASGNLTTGAIPVGNNTELGEVTLPLNTLTAADKLTLTIPGTEYSNDWSFWVYPAQSATAPGNTVICTALPDALTDLAQGKPSSSSPKTRPDCRKGRRRLPAHFLEQGLVSRTKRAHARHADSKPASCAGRFPHGFPRRLAVVGSHAEFQADDARRASARPAPHRPTD